MPGRDDSEDNGPEPRPEGGEGSGGQAADAHPAVPDPGSEPDAASDLGDDADVGDDAGAEFPMEPPSPGVPVSPEEYRRLKKQAAEMPEDS